MLNAFLCAWGSGTCRIQVRVLMDVFLAERICGRMSVSKHLECSPSFPFPFPFPYIPPPLPPSLPFLPSLILSQHRLSISIAFSLLSSSHPPSSNQNYKIINYKSQVTFRYLPPNPLSPLSRLRGKKFQQKKRRGWCFCEWAKKGEGVNWDGFGWGSGDGGSRRRRATREDLLNELGSIMECLGWIWWET